MIIPGWGVSIGELKEYISEVTQNSAQLHEPLSPSWQLLPEKLVPPDSTR